MRDTGRPPAKPPSLRKARSPQSGLRQIAYERRVRLALFRLDIDHVLILILIFGHLTQELLKPAAGLGAYLALKLREPASRI